MAKLILVFFYFNIMQPEPIFFGYCMTIDWFKDGHLYRRLLYETVSKGVCL